MPHSAHEFVIDPGRNEKESSVQLKSGRAPFCGEHVECPQ